MRLPISCPRCGRNGWVEVKTELPDPPEYKCQGCGRATAQHFEDAEDEWIIYIQGGIGR